MLRDYICVLWAAKKSWKTSKKMSTSGENIMENEKISGSERSTFSPEEDESINDAETSDQFANSLGSFKLYQ